MIRLTLSVGQLRGDHIGELQWWTKMCSLGTTVLTDGVGVLKLP